MTDVTVGVLALQGSFASHASLLRGLGAGVREVRTPAELSGVDGLVIPGGESTTMTWLIGRGNMAGPLADFAASGRPVLGTCAGLIMLDQDHLGLMDIRAERNAFGRQVNSFEQHVNVDCVDGGPVRAVFIRAPWVGNWGPGVRVLAWVDGHPVAVEQGNLLAIAFHPEIVGETRLHARFLAMTASGRAAA